MRFGIDLGGTKIEIVALDEAGQVCLRHRVPTPKPYEEIIQAIAALIAHADRETGTTGSIGIGIPGSLSPATGLVRNANTQALNGRPLDRDLIAALGRPVRVTNDANCLAMSEAADGAGAGYRTVFAVIMGTGCGGGIVSGGRILDGPNGTGGEWGHAPLPWMLPEEYPGRRCFCGQLGCLETFLAGPGLAFDCDGPGSRDATSIPRRAAAGEEKAIAALARHTDRLARALGMISRIIDPDVVVLGGGLSNMQHLYAELPKLMTRYVLGDVAQTPIVQAKHGDSSGVFGAARLWDMT